MLNKIKLFIVILLLIVVIMKTTISFSIFCMKVKVLNNDV